MNKKSIGMISGAVVVGGAAAAYMLLRPAPTPEDVKTPVDEQFEKLEIVLNDLDAKVQQPEANVDSLYNLMETLRWDGPLGGEYEKKKFNLYLDHKKNVAMTFLKVIQERQLDGSYQLLDDVEAIKE